MKPLSIYTILVDDLEVRLTKHRVPDLIYVNNKAVIIGYAIETRYFGDYRNKLGNKGKFKIKALSNSLALLDMAMKSSMINQIAHGPEQPMMLIEHSECNNLTINTLTPRPTMFKNLSKYGTIEFYDIFSKVWGEYNVIDNNYKRRRDENV